MNAEWFLRLAWSVFRGAAGKCDETAYQAFLKRYGQTARDGAETFTKDPEQAGEVLSWLLRGGHMCRLLAMRHNREVNADDVLTAADAIAQVSGTTWCG